VKKILSILLVIVFLLPNSISFASVDSEKIESKFNFKDGAEVFLAVSASVAASALFAKQAYPGEGDKITHAVGGSLIGSGATLFSYYGLNVSENKAALIGFATAIAAGLVKEYIYDTAHTDNHVVDARDALMTGVGGGFGAFFIRLKFGF
jgi:hypothetical protein